MSLYITRIDQYALKVSRPVKTFDISQLEGTRTVRLFLDIISIDRLTRLIFVRGN
jgi:hypothetical protein